MDKYRLQWAGAPCGQHGSYTFYKAVKFFKNGRWRIVSLGEFFFLKFSETDPLCIGELQLLWEDRSADGLMLSSSRFYFLPESTPDGRKQNHGEDEVIAVEGKAIFKLEDLMDWICTDVEWNRGAVAVCSKDVKGGSQCNNNNGQLDDFALNNSKLNYADVKQEKKLIGDNETKGGVKILSFPGYCRYKTVLKRLEHNPDGWLNDALVRALGGFTVPHRGTRLMYCKEEFEHPTLAYHEKLCDHLAPNLKGRPRKKRFTSKEKLSLLVRRTSEDLVRRPSEDDSTSIPDTKVEKIKLVTTVEKIRLPKRKSKKHKKNKRRRAKNEQSEVRGHVNSESGQDKMGEKTEVKKGRKSMESHLLAFMKSRNTPITRVPNLGFKKINIGLFWKMGQKLGGYEVICKKRLWKKIYDRLGGSPESTSAATCTRRHYERLILPYERHLKGLGHLPLPKVYQRPIFKEEEEENEEGPKNGECTTNQDRDNEYNFHDDTTEETTIKKEDDEDDEATRTRKALKALKKKRKPKEKAKKLKDQLKEIREKKAQLSLQPIAAKDGLLLSSPLNNLPPPGTSINTTKPNMPGVMADKAVLFPNIPPGQVPTSLGGLRPITVTTEGGVPGSMGPVILTIPHLHHPHLMNQLPPGVIATNPKKTEGLVSSSSGESKPMFTPHTVSGLSGVITRAPMIPPHTSITAPRPPSISQSQVIMKASQAESRPSGHLPPQSTNGKTIDNPNVSRSRSSPVYGSTVTSRPSVIQHTQHARTPPYMHSNAVHPNDLILRNMSPRKAQAAKASDKHDGKNHPNGADPIIVTPVNPYLPRYPGMPPMMMPGQIPFPHPALHEQPPMNAKRRRTESGKENLDDKSPPPTSLPPHMPTFYPVSVPVPMPRLVPPPFQSLPEQDEPCDLSMPKKRKHEGHSVERQVIKERRHNNSPSPHVRSMHGSKHKNYTDYPSELLNHRTHRDEDRHHIVHSRVPIGDDLHKLHNSIVKMTPQPRGSITQGVINPPINSIAKVHRESTSPSSSNKHVIKSETPTYIPHTSSSIPSFSSDPQGKGQMLLPDFPNPHLLAAAAAGGFAPRFHLPFVPPHLLSPQLLASLPPHLAALNHEELLRRGSGGFIVPPLRYPPPGLVGGALSPSPVKKEGQHAYAFQG